MLLSPLLPVRFARHSSGDCSLGGRVPEFVRRLTISVRAGGNDFGGCGPGRARFGRSQLRGEAPAVLVVDFRDGVYTHE